LADRLIVSVGHLVSRKRHHVLIQAMATVRRHEPNSQLVIVGSPSFERDYPNSLRRMIRALGLESCVKLLGNQPPSTVADWLRAADVFALGTAREGCCNAVLEALAVGTPVVTTAAGDNAYFVKHDSNGLIVATDDANGMAGAIEKAFQAERWNRAEASQQIHERLGSWDSVAQILYQHFAAQLSLN
jgi:glycosyltransferase involved in cell wall biosynthesis